MGLPGPWATPRDRMLFARGNIRKAAQANHLCTGANTIQNEKFQKPSLGSPCRDLYTPTLSHRLMDCPPNDQERPTCDSCARTFASEQRLFGHQKSCKKTIKSKKSQFDRRRHHNNPKRRRNPPPISPPDDVELTALFKQYDNLCFGGQLQKKQH